MAQEEDIGLITLINGPVVFVEGFKSPKIRDMCLVGDYKIPGEIIRLNNDKAHETKIAIVQVYEDTTGIQLGEQTVCLGHPLSMELGPGLLGHIIDGIERPLDKYFESVGGFVKRGLSFPPLDRAKNWPFRPVVEANAKVTGGDVVGEVQETGSIVHRIIVPPKISGRITNIVPEGDYTVEDIVYSIEDAAGNTHDLKLYHEWPITLSRPFAKRLLPIVPMMTGVRLIDCLFPITKGGCATVPGGFGTGKTVLQQQIAKYCDAQVILYIGCGERGNELADVLESFPKLKDPTGNWLMDRTVVIGNTSNMPVSAREASIFTGITLAEYFRDQGYNVALMADSTSRWAEALREISGRLEELPAEGGYPAYLGRKIASFYERAGYVEILGSEPRNASISIIGAVSPPGGDFSDPVVQTTKRFIKAFWALDAKLAYSRQYPAINWIDSYSLYTNDIKPWYIENIDPDWAKFQETIVRILHEDFELQDLVRLLGADALPLSKQLGIFTADLIKKSFLGQNAFDDVDANCSLMKQSKMLRLFATYYSLAMDLLDHGAPLFRLEELKVMDQINRVRMETKNEDYMQIDDIMAQMRAEIDAIRKEIM
jgi:V/A-type H+-transporting ATPase subunit A